MPQKYETAFVTWSVRALIKLENVATNSNWQFRDFVGDSVFFLSVHVKIVGDFCLCCSNCFFLLLPFSDISTIRVQFPIFTFCESARQSTDLKTWSQSPFNVWLMTINVQNKVLINVRIIATISTPLLFLFFQIVHFWLLPETIKEVQFWNWTATAIWNVVE